MPAHPTDSPPSRPRVQSLDHLRGLMALAVMAYHYIGWSVGPQHSETVLGRLGIYAVSIFYILSGVSLSLVYAGSLRSAHDLPGFAVKRIFRIFPLFYVVVTCALLLGWFSSLAKGVPYTFPLSTAILNYTLTFGFIDPTAYLSTGAWSIGNEIVFYAVFPFLMLWAAARGRRVLLGAFLAGVAIELYFAFGLLSADRPIEAQWALYVHPLNQVFLFLGGVCIGAGMRPGRAGRPALPLATAAACVAVFCLWPASGNQASLVAGSTRLVMSAACLGLVAAVCAWNPASDSPWVRPLAFLGEGCYSIYLLHPIVAIPVVLAFERLRLGPVGAAYATAFALTLVLSGLSFRYLEQPMIRAGRRVGARLDGGWRAAPPSCA